MKKSDLSEFGVEEENFKLKIKRDTGKEAQPHIVSYAPAQPSVPAPQTAPMPQAAPAAASAPPKPALPGMALSNDLIFDLA